MKLLLVLFLVSFVMDGFCQNLKNSKGKRTGHWIYYGKDRPRSNYPMNSKIEEGRYIDGLKDGIWIKYYPDGKTKKLEGNFINNRPKGIYTRYYDNGVKMESGNFSYKNFNGPYFRYYRNGKISYKCTFNKQGKETGLVQHFHSNGILAMEYTAKDGLVVGKLSRYYEDGSVKEIINYNENGKISNIEFFDPKQIVLPPTPVKDNKKYPPKIKDPNTHGIKFERFGQNILFNENDQYWIDGIFKNGQLWDGRVFDYDSDGNLLKVRVFKKGVYHSEGQL